MGTRILIAEDEPYIVESLRFLLSREGHQVDEVSDGSSVLPTLHRTRPDLLILDIMMPSANGFDVLRRIRQTPELENLPVLILTAKGQETDRKRMVELGANDFVTKPFSNMDLLTRVSDLLEKIEPANGEESAAR